MAKHRLFTRRTKWERWGFLPEETKEFSHISGAGLNAPYVKELILRRRALYMNAKRWGWSYDRYYDYIRQDYEEKIGKVHSGKNRPWQYLRWYEEKIPDKEAYTSPWRRFQKKTVAKEHKAKPITRASQMKANIDVLRGYISRDPNSYMVRKWEREIAAYEKTLKELENS